MNRRVLGGVIAVVVVLVGVWLLFFRESDDDKPAEASNPQRTGAIAVKPAAKSEEPQRPRGQAPRWSIDVDREGPLRLEGQVVGPGGKGVGGAEVWLSSVPPRSVKSDDDGSFVFEKLVGRTYQLTASTADMVGGPVSFKLAAGIDPVVIRLVEGGAVTVTVVNEQKEPISGADVKVAEVAEHVAHTDVKGEATLKPVHAGYVAVQATATGYAATTGYTTIGSAGARGTVRLTLKKGFAVTGHVIDEAGKPIAKVNVSASGGRWADDDGPDGEAHKGSTTTNAKGEFTIPALANGTHQLVALDGEHAPARTPVVVEDKPVGGVEIVMRDGGVVSGKVVDGDGKPVPFALVRVAGQSWTVAARQSSCDKTGVFELHGLARAKLQARAESDAAASDLAEVDLTTKAIVKGLVLKLDVSGSIAGVVVDETGAPVPEVQVNAFPDIMKGANADDFALAGMSSVTTDGGGAFTIHGLPDKEYRLWAARAGSGAQEWGQRGVAAKTGDKNVRVTLAAGGTLVGKITLAGAAAPKLAHVAVGYHAPTQIIEGNYTVKDLAPGMYSVTFHGPEFAEYIKHDVKIESGKTTDLGTIEVTKGRRLAGKVVDNTGAPVAGAKIKLAEMLMSASGADESADDWEAIAGVRSAVSDSDGDFAIVGVPRKATNAMADSPRGRSLAVAIPEGTDDPPAVTLTLRGFGTISGTVTYKGQPQSGVTIGESSKGGGAQASFGQTDDAGNFKLTKVPEGVHVLQAIQTKLMSIKSTTVNATVVAGRDTHLVIDIPVGQITLAINVKAMPNNKVDAAQIFLFAGTVAIGNAKQLTDTFFQSGIQGMKFWLGAAMPAPEFEELVPGDYTVCAIPITGPFADPSFQQQLQENMQVLKVYCKQVKVPASPVKQSVVDELPAMDPLPKHEGS